MKFVFDNPTFSFEALRTLNYAPYGGADVGEVLSTSYKIKDGDFESWYTEWLALANQLLKRAQDFEKSENRISASESYFKASNYFRTAEFFLHGNPDDPKIMSTWGASRDSFRKGLSLSDEKAEIIEIPYEDTTMPAYFYKIDDEVRPTIIIHGGYDSISEELYFQVVKEALAQGYDAITFDGPGQGAMIREKHIPFRPDWEAAVTPVVDYLETRPEVDKNKIALMGISFGGLLAPRAAAKEHRIAAVIADDGLYSFQYREKFASKGHDLGENFDEEGLNGAIRSIMKKDTQVHWAVDNGLFTFAVKSPSELVKVTDGYTLEGVIDQIKAPVLVGEATNDIFFKGQPELLYNGLTSPKVLMTFGPDVGAEEHCHIGALTYFNAKVFEWLNQTFGLTK